MKAKSMLTKSVWCLLFLLPMAVCPPANGKIIYVDDDANGANDGSSWENAYNFLQDALADANSTDKPVEIRVAQSICKPDQGSNQTQGDRKATFQLLKETIVKGGYAGFGHEDPNARDFELYKTILSGDLADNDVPIDDMHLLSENISILSNDPSRADNSFRIVTVISADSNILLEGAVITGSYDDYSLRKDDYISAGLYIQGTPNVTIRNCEFTRNAASGVLLKEEPTLTSEDCIFRKNTAISNGGGGICINYGGRARIVGCTFKDNWASSGGGVYFGAKIFTSDYLSSRQQEEIYLTDCTFIRNRAQYGGAIGCNYSTFYIEHTTFCENSAVCTGGAIRCRQSITNCCHCIFSGNSALDSGASIWTNGYKTRYMSAKQFIHTFNCTFRGNAAPIGRTLASMSFEKEYLVTVIISNCILDNDGSEIYNPNGSKITIDYTDLLGGAGTIDDPCNTVVWGLGNIDTDPCFVKPGYWADADDPNIAAEPNGPNVVWIEGDYHLKSQAGRWNSNSQSWVQDDVTSPCIDAGNPMSPIDYEPSPNGGRINMGAFGGTQQASMSIYDVNTFTSARVPNPNDGAVDVFLEIMPSWISGPNVIMHDIYFGTSELPPFFRQQYQREFYPGALEPDTRYYWRIDDIDSLLNRSVGNIWTFVTEPQPAHAYNPNPPDGAIGVSPVVVLSWSPGEDAVSHNVYFGSFYPPPMFVRNQTETEFNPGQLRPQGMLYTQERCHWRIDEIDSQGNITTGDIWKFQVHEYKGRMCFISETPVYINGELVPFSNVTKEQLNSGIVGQNMIEGIQEHEGTFVCYDVSLESGNSITVAENHYFMSESGRWLSLHELKAGTRLKTSKGIVGIISVKKKPDPYIGKVYNLKVAGSDRYMVGKDMVIVRDY